MFACGGDDSADEAVVEEAMEEGSPVMMEACKNLDMELVMAGCLGY